MENMLNRVHCSPDSPSATPVPTQSQVGLVKHQKGIVFVISQQSDKKMSDMVIDQCTTLDLL